MQRTKPILVLAVCATVSACDERPQSLIICHNANCAHETNPFADDNLASLTDSLELTYLGRTTMDGVELDTIWDRQGARCLFGHDFDHIFDPAETAMQAAELVAAHLRKPTDFVSWGGNRFFVKIELKREVTALNDPHTDEERLAHLACAYDMVDVLRAAATEAGRELELMFESEDVELIRGLPRNPRWPGKDPDDRTRLRLIAQVQSTELVLADLTSLTTKDDGEGIDILSFHTSRLPDGLQQSFFALDASLMLWMLDASLESLYTMGTYHPEYVITGEAQLFRRWEEF